MLHRQGTLPPSLPLVQRAANGRPLASQTHSLVCINLHCLTRGPNVASLVHSWPEVSETL